MSELVYNGQVDRMSLKYWNYREIGEWRKEIHLMIRYIMCILAQRPNGFFIIDSHIMPDNKRYSDSGKNESNHSTWIGHTAMALRFVVWCLSSEANWRKIVYEVRTFMDGMSQSRHCGRALWIFPLAHTFSWIFIWQKLLAGLEPLFLFVFSSLYRRRIAFRTRVDSENFLFWAYATINE